MAKERREIMRLFIRKMQIHKEPWAYQTVIPKEYTSRKGPAMSNTTGGDIREYGEAGTVTYS